MENNFSNMDFAKKKFKFMVRNKVFETEKRYITGKEVLEMAGLIPPSAYKLDLKMRGNSYREIGLDDVVDLVARNLPIFLEISRRANLWKKCGINSCYRQMTRNT